MYRTQTESTIRMKIKIIKPLFSGGKTYFKVSDIVDIKFFCGRALYNDKGHSVFIPKEYYEIVKEDIN